MSDEPKLWKSVLEKAASDPFDYALKTRSGQVFRFIDACRFVDKEGTRWIQIGHLIDLDTKFTFPRGIDIREDAIEWICDAPCGS